MIQLNIAYFINIIGIAQFAMPIARRKTPGLGGNKKALEVSLPESSRKFITCIRKYTLLYLNLLEKTGDLSTLERAYMTLRTDKRVIDCSLQICPFYRQCTRKPYFIFMFFLFTQHRM